MHIKLVFLIHEICLYLSLSHVSQGQSQGLGLYSVKHMQLKCRQKIGLSELELIDKMPENTWKL